MKLANKAALPAKQFSVIHMFREFEKLAKQIQKDVERNAALTIQKDAYGRLGSDVNEDECFASFEYTSKQTDDTLRFSLDLFTSYVVLDVEAVGSFIGFYQEMQDDEKLVAKQLADCITMLLNGQFSVLLTLRFDEACASEFIYRPAKNAAPIIINTQADYPRRWKKNDRKDYDVLLLSNNYSLDMARPKEHFFLFDYTINNKIKPQGRSLENKEITPLTKGDFLFVAEELSMTELGKKPGEMEWSLYYRSWEFWAVVFVAIGGGYGIYTAGLLPKSIGEFGHIIALFLWAGLFRWIIDILLSRKERLRISQPDHPQIKFDEWIKNRLPSVAFTLYGAASMWLFTQPLFAIKEGETFNFYTLLNDHRWLLIAPVLAVTGSLYSWVSRASALYIPGIAISFANLVLAVANFMYSDTTIETPEPYSSIAAFFVVGAAIVLPVFAFYQYKSYWENQRQNHEKDIWEIVAIISRRLFLATNVVGPLFVIASAFMLQTDLKQDMLKLITPSQYAAATLLLGVLWLIVGMYTVIRKSSQSTLYYTQATIALLLLGVVGILSTDKINDLPNTTFYVEFASIFVPLMVGVFNEYSRDYLFSKSMTMRNF